MALEGYRHNSEAAATWKKPVNPRLSEGPKATEFPKNLEERFNAVLNIINNENKAFTIGWLLDNNWRTKEDLERLAKGYVFPLFKPPTAKSYQQYCDHTLIPIGAVAEEKIIIKGRTNPVSHYRLTEDGEKYAKPIAQFALKTAVDSGISMFEILGSSNSRGDTRAPYNRAKILLELQKQSSLSEIQIADILGMSQSTTRDNLSALKGNGFLTYESIPLKKSGWSVYEWVPGKKPEEAVTVVRFPILTRKVAHKMQEIQSSNRNELANIFEHNKDRISKVLVGLERQGLVRNIRERSNATITEKGSDQKFIGTLNKSLEKDDLSDISKEIEIFKDNSVSNRYIAKALKLYADVSPYSKRVPREDNKYAILSMLKNQRLRAKQITENLGKNSISYLRELIDNGEIIKEKRGLAVYYSLNPNPKK